MTTDNLKLARFDFDTTLAMLRGDFERVGGSDALEDVKEIYRGVLFFSIQNLYQLRQLFKEGTDDSLAAWIADGAGRYKKASIETLTIFRTNLLPESDYEGIVEELRECYLELAQSEEEDELREIKKKLVLTLFSLNFTLFFEGGEEAYMEAQEWLMDREFGDIKD